MGEVKNTPFSFPELRTIVKNASDPERLRHLATEVRLLKSALKENPDIVWEDYRKQKGDDYIDEGNLLKSTFERYQSNRKATKYWQKKFEDNSPTTLTDLRRNLDIPNSINIQSIQFLEDCVAILMDSEGVNAFYNHILKKGGEKRGEGLTSVGGFVSNTNFLEDEDGNKCRIIISNTDSQDVIVPHEREHILFEEYYKRKPVSKDFSPQEDLRVKTRKEFKGKLGGLTKKLEVEQAAKSYLKPILNDARLLFYNEVIAETTSLYTVWVNMTDKSWRLQMILEDTSDSFNLAVIHSLGTGHSYGANLSQVVDGLRDNIEELPNLSSQEKLELKWSLEMEAASVSAEARIISGWIEALWKKTNGNVDNFISILEVIPFKYVSSIGYFIDQDPEILEQQLKRRSGEQEKMEEQSLWRMMLSHANESEKIRQLPKQATYTKDIKAILERGFVKKGKISLGELFASLKSKAVDYYISKHRELISELYKEYTILFNQLGLIGVPTDQYRWMMRRFMETYSQDQLNFQVFRNAITELLEENNQTGITSKVLDIYEELERRDTKGRKEGFGYRIVHEEKKLLDKLERSKK